MKLVTTRFGEIEVNEDRIVEMRGPILGFEHLKRYILLAQNEKTPFCWFQSLDDGAAAFVVINPFVVKPDYEPLLDDAEMKLLEIEKSEDVVILSIVTIRPRSFEVSVNLRAPLVINVRKMAAKQVILGDPSIPIQFYLRTAPMVEGEKRLERQGKSFDLLQIGHAVAL